VRFRKRAMFRAAVAAAATLGVLLAVRQFVGQEASLIAAVAAVSFSTGWLVGGAR
jgi:hypothetical protein